MINTYNESDLHKSLKNIFKSKNSETEVPLMGSICDILSPDGKITEIQTSNLSSLRLKLEKFLPYRAVEVVYPISVNSYIIMTDENGLEKYKRKSPKHGCIFQVFKEVSGIYHLHNNKNLNLKIVFIESEIIKTQVKKSFHASIINKRLLKILEIKNFNTISELCFFILKDLPKEFTNKDLKNNGAGKYASYTSWFLKKTEYIKPVGKKGKSILYIKIK